MARQAREAARRRISHPPASRPRVGAPDVPGSTPIYVGPFETTLRKFDNVVVSPVIDRALEGKGALREWAYVKDPSGVFEGVLDVFGDGSFWALHVPGHTPGMTSY